jgi:hypothetical protein
MSTQGQWAGGLLWRGWADSRLLGAVIVFPIWFLVRLFRKSPPKA